MAEENPVVKAYAELGKALREGAEKTARQMEEFTKLFTKKDQ